MRSSLWCAVVLACSLLACGGDVEIDGDPYGPDFCCNLWSIYVLPGGNAVQVGTTREVVIGPVVLPEKEETKEECRRRTTSVDWRAEPSGIVSFAPTESLFKAILTGETSGETDVWASITCQNGTVATSHTTNVRVVPAS